MALEEPDYPAEMDYLRQWSRELFGRSGIGMEGVAPLKPTEVEAWARLNGLDLTPLETQALFRLDTVRRHPEVMDDVTAKPEPALRGDAAARWPTRNTVRAS